VVLVPAIGATRSTPGHKGNNDVGGVTIEVGASPVVVGRGAGVLVAGGELDVAQRHTGVEGRHDESGSQHVRVDQPEACSLADRPDPAMGGTTVQVVPVLAMQDRPLTALADSQVDGPGGSGDERDDGRLVALPDDAQRPVATLHPEVLDVGGTGLADPESVETQEDGQGGVIPGETLGGEQEGAELALHGLSNCENGAARGPEAPRPPKQ
jgi:hypothetical protein